MYTVNPTIGSLHPFTCYAPAPTSFTLTTLVVMVDLFTCALQKLARITAHKFRLPGVQVDEIALRMLPIMLCPNLCHAHLRGAWIISGNQLFGCFDAFVRNLTHNTSSIRGVRATGFMGICCNFKSHNGGRTDQCLHLGWIPFEPFADKYFRISQDASQLGRVLHNLDCSKARIRIAGGC